MPFYDAVVVAQNSPAHLREEITVFCSSADWMLVRVEEELQIGALYDTSFTGLYRAGLLNVYIYRRFLWWRILVRKLTLDNMRIVRSPEIVGLIRS